MSTATTDKNQAGTAPGGPAGSGVNFLRVLKSEWIKVTTVPSTVILLAVTVVVMIGLASLAAWGTAQLASESAPAAGASAPAVPGEGSGTTPAVPEGATAPAVPEGATAPAEQTAPGVDTQTGPPAADSLVRDIPASGLFFGQLLIASLGVVLIASEWGTGMIRSTFSAVPKRTPALLAKNLIIAVVSFVVGAGAAFISYLIARPILGTADLSLSLGDEGVLASILNTGTCLALIAVFAMAIGTLLRNTAGGVVTAIGIIFVLPLVVQIVSGLADWIPDAARILPSNAGAQLVSAGPIADGDLTQLQGGLVLAAWAAVLLVVSLVVTKRRDV
ncbi:ABC transporter permease [Arthrobacter sp. zg-Y20]|uniref:ABC transporter permease subunit n=1 Tax=unclassified Arthrobacter TaxID=235627 RepID=UPI001D142ED7|nr:MULTISPECIES: ABC transporter permease subunit [unclassified Arthrobacter]MCC3275582.1 ABC transporter permease [Arthrobacter sp. zg-Y20]MDK1315739.1 ABC transporter permease subunit [Arthrobacter sp. zg.Y20]WIB06146.1 ABC transporter permease subunit [Arthrobacter sp. zg-Y20]